MKSVMFLLCWFLVNVDFFHCLPLVQNWLLHNESSKQKLGEQNISNIGMVMFDANQISDNQFSFKLLRSNGHSVFFSSTSRKASWILWPWHDFSGPLGWLTKIPKRLGLDYIGESEVIAHIIVTIINCYSL